MTYQMSNFIKKYFNRYCEMYFPEDCKEISNKADVFFDKFMGQKPDMGEKGNIMASNIDLVAAFLAYYEASNHRVGGEVIDILTSWLVEDYQKWTFITDMNKHQYVRKVYYKIYGKHAKLVEEHKAKGEWVDTWSFDINPDHRKEGIYYHMKGCPLYKFAKELGYVSLMPYICKFDFIFEKILHAKLIRHQTEATGGDYCDYWFVPDQSDIAVEYRDFVSK